MERPHALLVIIAFGLGACEVADLPPLRSDATRADTTTTTDAADTRVAETVEAETVEAETVEAETVEAETVEDTLEPGEVDAVDDDVAPEVEDGVDGADALETIDDDVLDDTTADTSEVVTACVQSTVATPTVASPHVTTCSELTFATNPPTSGPHYPIWAQISGPTARPSTPTRAVSAQVCRAAVPNRHTVGPLAAAGTA